MLYKIFWVLRAFIYKPFFGSIKMVSYIGPPVVLKGVKNIFIGKRVRIYPNSRLETHNNGKIIIEDNCAIAQNVHITSASNLVIGHSTTILANSFVTNIDHDYTEIDIPILDQKNIIKDTKIGTNCFIGMGSAIQAGTILGNQCIVGANSVVRGHFDDYSVIVGSPAKVVKKYDLELKKWIKL